MRVLAVLLVLAIVAPGRANTGEEDGKPAPIEAEQMSYVDEVHQPADPMPEVEPEPVPVTPMHQGGVGENEKPVGVNVGPESAADKEVEERVEDEAAGEHVVGIVDVGDDVELELVDDVDTIQASSGIPAGLFRRLTLPGEEVWGAIDQTSVALTVWGAVGLVLTYVASRIRHGASWQWAVCWSTVHCLLGWLVSMGTPRVEDLAVAPAVYLYCLLTMVTGAALLAWVVLRGGLEMWKIVAAVVAVFGLFGAYKTGDMPLAREFRSTVVPTLSLFTCSLIGFAAQLTVESDMQRTVVHSHHRVAAPTPARPAPKTPQKSATNINRPGFSVTLSPEMERLYQKYRF